jgi:ribonuclease D
MKVITKTTELAALCAQLARHAYVAVDTEFMRETTYWPKLCLIQMAGPEEAACIDPLAQGLDLAPFHELMANANVVKVFHAARQDVEIIHFLGKIIPHPLFDTQVAAMVCGFGESISYVNLVKQLANVDIDKTSRYTDWARRPLSQKQLDYAIGDVIHLCTVYEKLSAELEAGGRAHWLEEEMAVLENPANYESKPEESWRRLKSRVRGRKGLAILIELAAWRERTAQAHDVPRGRILRDEQLYDIANHAPATLEELAELRSLSGAFTRSPKAKEVIDCVAAGMRRDLKTLPQQQQGVIVPAEKQALVELLRVHLKAAASRNRVAPRLIADTEEIERLVVERNPDIAALKGWRRELFGADALRLKSGELALSVANGEVVTIAVPTQTA